MPPLMWQQQVARGGAPSAPLRQRHASKHRLPWPDLGSETKTRKPPPLLPEMPGHWIAEKRPARHHYHHLLTAAHLLSPSVFQTRIADWLDPSCWSRHSGDFREQEFLDSCLGECFLHKHSFQFHTISTKEALTDLGLKQASLLFHYLSD